MVPIDYVYHIACPEKYDQIDEMMIEYEGREEVLIGHLSTMLVAKNRANASESETEDSGSGDEEDPTIKSSTTTSEFSLSSLRVSGLSSLGLSVRTVDDEPLEETPRETPESSSDAAEMPDKSKSSNPFDDEKDGTKPSSASAAAMAALLADDDSDNDSEDSSSAGSSEWSSDDGFSSIDTSSFATNDTGDRLSVREFAHSTSDASDHSGAGLVHGAPKPMFVPVDEEDATGDGRKAPASVTRNDLDEAIQAGDWQAVGATAALIANIGPPTSPPPTTSPTKSKQDDFNASNFSVTSHEKHQVEELENLVEAGDWTAVMAAATRFETASDTDSLRDLMESRQSMFDESMQGMDTSREQSPEKPSEKSPDNSIVSPESSSPESNAESRSSWSDANPGLRAEIEDLVKSVVPEELGKLRTNTRFHWFPSIFLTLVPNLQRP